MMDYLIAVKSSLILWLGSSSLRRVETASVRGLGIRERMPAKTISRPGGTDDYLFMHFYDPVGISVAGGMEYVSPHSFIIWEPKAPHLFGDTQRPWNHSWIHCSGSAIVESLAANGIEANHPIPLSDDAVVNRYLPAVSDEIQHHSEPDPVILGLLFAAWLREVERDRDRTVGGSTIPANLLGVKRFIESHLSETIRLDDLAAQALISPSRLSAQFKRYFHTSPIDYVLRMRLRRASHLLLDRNLTMSQVARQVGFSDPFYFSRQFKTHYGVSPMAYRRQVHRDIACAAGRRCRLAGGRTSHRICVARSDSPLGPFADAKAPLLDIGKAVIDAHVRRHRRQSVPVLRSGSFGKRAARGGTGTVSFTSFGSDRTS